MLGTTKPHRFHSISEAYAEAERRWPLCGEMPVGEYRLRLSMQGAFIDGARWFLEMVNNED